MNSFEFAVVSESESKNILYPYVYINDDGTYRELTKNERKYLETPFHPGDGGRPYVKSGYSSKTPNGKIHGFLHRQYLPKSIKKKK